MRGARAPEFKFYIGAIRTVNVTVIAHPPTLLWPRFESLQYYGRFWKSAQSRVKPGPLRNLNFKLSLDGHRRRRPSLSPGSIQYNLIMIKVRHGRAGGPGRPGIVGRHLSAEPGGSMSAGGGTVPTALAQSSARGTYSIRLSPSNPLSESVLL